MKFHKRINLLSGTSRLQSLWKFTYGHMTSLWKTVVQKLSVETGLLSPIKVSRDETSCPSSLSTPMDLAALRVHMLPDLALVILHCISKPETWKKYKVHVSEKLCETRSQKPVKHVCAAVIVTEIQLLRTWIILPLKYSLICGEERQLGL